MSELGTLLKVTREKKGYTLDELQEKTKIQKRYLEAIESGRYDRLPGPFYTRAFIRSVADVLGLDPDLLFKQYGDELPKVVEAQEAPMRLSRHKRFSKPDLFGPWVARALLVLFFLLIVTIVYIFVVRNAPPSLPLTDLPGTPKVNDKLTGMSGDGSQDAGKNTSGDRGSNETPAPVSDQTKGTEGDGAHGNAAAPEDAHMPSSPDGSPSQPELKLVEEVGKTSRYVLTGVSTFQAELEAQGGDVWVKVTANSKNGPTLLEKTLKGGETITLSVGEATTLYFSFGRTRNARLHFSGLTLDLSDKPDVYRVEVSLAKDPATL